MNRFFYPVLLLLSIAGVAQPPAQPKPHTAPTIPDTLKLKFFKASSEAQSASAQSEAAAKVAQQKNTTFQAIVGELNKTCGEKFEPSMDKVSGDPICVVKVEPAKVEAKK